MANYNLGTAEGRIVIDSKGAITGVMQAEKAQAGMLGTMNRMTPALSKVGKGMVVVGGLAVAGFALAVKTSADFEKRISAIAAVSGATGKEINALREKALQLGKDTKFSASEAAQAMEELAKAGISTKDIMGGAADAVVALAAAGEVELPRAAEIAANAMNVFNIKASEMPHVADQIAGAANASAISVDEYAQSLQQSGAAAHLAGVSFEDLTTSIALMGNAGIKGSDAGTSLKTMLLNLNPTTEKQKNLMKELGIVTADGANRFFDASGKAKKMADIAGVLGGALKGMTKQQKLATLETLFGSDAIRAAAVIADEGSAGFEKMASSIGKISAADVAAKRMDNLAGSLEQFKGSLETALIKTGAPAQAAVRSLVDLGTKLLNMFLSLSPAAQKLVAQFLVFGGGATLAAGALLLLFVKMVQFTSSIKAAIIAVRAFGIASKLAFLTNPIFLVIAAVIALGAALFLLYKNNETVRRAVDAAWQFILGVFNNVKLAFQALVAAFSGEGITTEASSLVGVFERVGVAARAMVNFVIAAWQGIAAAWRSIWASLAPIVTPIFALIVTTIQNAIAIIIGIVKLFAALLTGNWTAAWNAIKGIASAVWNQILAQIRTIIAVIVAAWVSFGARMVSSAVAWIASVLAAFGRFVTQLPGRILFVIGFIIGRWLQFQVRMYTIAVQLGARVLAAIVSFFSKLPGRISSFITSAAARFAAWQSRMISLARSTGSRVLSSIISFLSQLPGRVGAYTAAATARMAQLASRLPALAGQAARGAVSAVASGLAALPGIVSGAVGRAISAFQGMIGQAFAAARSLASSLWSGFKAGLFGSPRTKIEYAMIAMRQGFQDEVKKFAKQDQKFKRMAGSFFPAVDRNVTALPVVAKAAGGVAQTNVFNISGVRDADEVRAVVTGAPVLRTLSQAARARGG